MLQGESETRKVEMMDLINSISGSKRRTHLEEQGDTKMTTGGEFMYALTAVTQGQSQSCCRSEPVAHMKNKAVPTSFLKLPVGRENRIYN